MSWQPEESRYLETPGEWAQVNAAKPISVAAAEHLATVEHQRDELLDVARQLRDYILNNHATGYARSSRVTDLLGEP